MSDQFQFLAEERLREAQMPGAGDCAFEAICAMLPKGSEWNPRSLREAVVDELLRDGVISVEYICSHDEEGGHLGD